MVGPEVTGWFERAQRVMPGGVNSPVRAFRAVGGTPIVIRRGQGAFIEDEDGREYLDFVSSWGPLILGHAHPAVVDAIQDATARGTSFGAPCRGEVELAETVTSLYPGIDQVRFVSSGTEAAMSAIRLARGVTGRDFIVKFSGCYHGHVDHLLVAAGSGLVTLGRPSSEGVPEAFVEKTIILPLDDEEAFCRLMAERGSEIAAVAIEPIPANNGLLVQRASFLECLRRETKESGSILLFDEVISGFRVAPGGASERLGIQPDVACFGKVIGGGMPVGAFGAKREIMDHLAPNGGVYQAGTLSGNPVAMAAGAATLRTLQENDGWEQLEQIGAYLEEKMTPVLSTSSHPARFVRVGSLFWISWQDDEPPRRADHIAESAADRYKEIFHGLLERGIAIAPSAYEVGFLSLAHTREHIDRLVAAFQELLP